MTEPTTAAGPTKEARLRIGELRSLGVEDEWSDKFYAALAALWQVVEGTEIPAQGTAPHVVMARLIEDVAWSGGAVGEREELDVERLARAYHNSTCDCDSFDPSWKRDVWPVVAAEYARLSPVARTEAEDR